MSGLILPAGVAAPRPNRSARRAARSFSNFQRPPGLPANLPPPGLALGHTDEHVVLLLTFGSTQLPLPMDVDQAIAFASTIAKLAGRVELLREQAGKEPGDGADAGDIGSDAEEPAGDAAEVSFEVDGSAVPESSDSIQGG
jgi:hypothetical protein